MIACNTSNRIRYYYENILRYDLLLKLNYNNIMQVPQICKIIILAHSVPYNNVKSVSLALEILCGQKVFCTILPDPSGHNFKASKKPIKNWRRSNAAWHSGKARSRIPTDRRISVSQSNSALLSCSLRARTMYNFLEKLISLRLSSSTETKSYWKVQGENTIQMKLGNRQLRLFPEIQNHFEFFECLQSIQIKLITSAGSKQETLLLWTGLQQKEI